MRLLDLFCGPAVPAYTEYIGKHILEVMNEKVN